mgnify:CR=1 FL=1
MNNENDLHQGCFDSKEGYPMAYMNKTLFSLTHSFQLILISARDMLNIVGDTVSEKKMGNFARAEREFADKG